MVRYRVSEDGDSFTQWDLVVVSISKGLVDSWGESKVIVDGSNVTMIARSW